MLKKTQRLRIKRFPKSAKTISNLFFTLKIIKNENGTNRYGFIVSKKVDKRAAVRNRAKRVFRACLERLDERMQKGYDMLFLLKKEMVKFSSKEVCVGIEQALLKEKLLL